MEYRTNFQSRAFEEAFRRRGVRYKLVGGFSFYNRAEVKDALAYVRLAMHPDDDVSLLRVLNVPPRGIGKTTARRIAGNGARRQFFPVGRNRKVCFRRRWRAVRSRRCGYSRK